MPAGEIVDVAVQVLRAHPVVGAVEPAFEQSPERLDPVGVHVPAHTLAGLVLDARVIADPVVDETFVAVHLSLVPDRIPDHLLNRLLIH